MPRAGVKDNSRVALRIRPDDKAVIMRPVAICQTDMTEFILRTALKEARAVIEEHERVKLSERDSRLVLALLETAPAPNAKLRKAARYRGQRPALERRRLEPFLHQREVLWHSAVAAGCDAESRQA